MPTNAMRTFSFAQYFRWERHPGRRWNAPAAPTDLRNVLLDALMPRIISEFVRPSPFVSALLEKGADLRAVAGAEGGAVFQKTVDKTC
jgi:hypothetical protein